MGVTVCVGGLIAAGKTTFIDKLHGRWKERGLSCKLMPEMYTDAIREMVRTNITVVDVFMFAHRLQMGIDACEFANWYDVVLLERSFIDHLAFVEAFEECEMISPQIAAWARQVAAEVDAPAPDRFVLLEVDPTVAIERIRRRGSNNDSVFNVRFLGALHRAYVRLVAEYYDDPIVLDWSQFGEEVCLEAFTDRLLEPLTVIG